MHARDHASELGTVRTGMVLTALLCVAELIGGWLTNSLALMSDAAHMFTDLAALGLAFFALRIAVLPASWQDTGSGVVTVAVAAVLLGFGPLRAAPTRPTIRIALVAGLAAFLVDVYLY